jgi:DNA-binding NarL/FixJ family response regulator
MATLPVIPAPPGFLAGLGLPPDQEAAYVVLLQLGRGRHGDVCAETKTAPDIVVATLSDLADLGLVSRTAEKDPTYLPLPIEQAVELLARVRVEQIERARQHAAAYAGLFRQPRDAGTADYLELVRGRDAIVQRFMQAQATVREEVAVFDKPPYVTPHRLNEPELVLLDRGVRCRVVYDAATLKLPGQIGWIEELVVRGEQARVNASVPLKMFLVDRSQAIVPLTVDDDRAADEALILTGPSSLLQALTGLFDLVWDRSRPFADPTAMAELDPGDRRLIFLLAAGLKDKSIATHLGVSVRTVERRVAEFMQRLGCTTRYQLGIATQARGWHDERAGDA